MNLIQILIRKTNNLVKNPNLLFIRLLCKISPLFRDDIYLKLLFPFRTGYKLNLNNPKTYNEKLQWLKINYRRPLLTIMADKYEAKSYTKEKIGSEYVVKSFGVWNTYDEIDFGILPKQFVLKTTHDQGGIVICKDKNSFDHKIAKIKLEKHLSESSYFITREWPYKNVQPRIMAEELLVDSEKSDLWDYKFYCFHGEPKVMYISMGRQSNHVPFYFYDMNFNLLDIKRPKHESLGDFIEKPKSWEKMIHLAQMVSNGLPHVRVDFYCVGDKVFSGEYTFFQGGGMMPFEPISWDYKFGDWINLADVQ